MRTALIMAGGTGGHVFPGLAVADELRAAGWEVVWMGAHTGMEARLVPARGYPMAWIRAAALRGKGPLAALLLPLNLLIGFWQAARAILRLRPDVVLGMGGYVAFHGGMMASLLARPLAVHEQNAIAGLTNRMMISIRSSAPLIVTEMRSGWQTTHCAVAPSSAVIGGASGGGRMAKWALRMAQKRVGAARPGTSSPAIHGGTASTTAASWTGSGPSP